MPVATRCLPCHWSRRLPRRLSGVLAAALVLGAPLAGHGAEIIELDAITLAGTGLPTEVLRNPAAITAIDMTAPDKTAPTIAGILREVPGVQISEEGIERIVIRGESSRRVAILIDGQKLTDHTDYGQPVLIDPATIERIEVVRGASSVVSGSRAIGGVINIVTRKGAARPLAFSGMAGWFSATDGYRWSGTLSGQRDAGPGVLDYRLSVGRMKQGDRRAPDGPVLPSDSRDRSASAHLGYRLGNHYFGLRAQRFEISANDYVDKYDPLTDRYAPDPAFRVSLPKRRLDKVSAFYEATDLAPWFERLSVDVYRQRIFRRFETRFNPPPPAPPLLRMWADSEDRQLTHGANIHAELRLSAHSRTALGFEVEDDRLTADRWTFKPMSVTQEVRHDRARILTHSLFAQHEIELGRDVTLTFGGRYYRVTAQQYESLTNGVANPLRRNSDRRTLFAAGLVWMPAPDLALRANLSQGYIYPTLGQLFLTQYAEGSTIAGNPNLRPERATTFELGARLDRGDTLLDATLFYNNARDYIAKTGPAGSKIYDNIDRARSWGIELRAEHHLAQWGLTPYAAATWMQRRMHYANGYSTADSGTVRLNGRIGVRKAIQLGAMGGEVDVFLRGASGTSLRNETGTLTDRVHGYGTLNLRGTLDLGPDSALVVEFDNLTNRRYKPFDQAPGARRSVNVYLTRSF